MEDDTTLHEAVLVRVETPEQTASADLVSFRTFSLGGLEQPFPILSIDKKRHRATILVHNPLGAAAPGTPPFVYIAQAGQVSANGDARGAAIVAGDMLQLETASSVWCVPTGSAVSVTVIEERYA